MHHDELGLKEAAEVLALRQKIAQQACRLSDAAPISRVWVSAVRFDSGLVFEQPEMGHFAGRSSLMVFCMARRNG